MRYLLPLLLFLMIPLKGFTLYETNPGFIEGSIIGVVRESPTQNLPVIYFNTYTGEGVNQHPEGQWHRVNVSHLVPVGTKAIHLTGRFIITQGYYGGTSNLLAYFRKTGIDTNYEYNHQCIETHTGGGQRSTMAVWVPLDGQGYFDFKWSKNVIGLWPDYPTFAIGLNVDAYVR